ncbi:hypothetical protein TUM4637_36020 [Shewanella hafniensis]|uniref:hypothetical protein n=1 Tax=Shewanella hafniensis TaxID=365590 RepID=UPI001BB91582|nr:hypothetical protein [Shewanella hafniensis]MCL1133019.1 hypothetical protein [Shewanella hafniensis]GIU37051.1 hypothetical protein TUM4637_36020 [Shewanella hafniensis]
MQPTVNPKIIEFIDYYKAEIYQLPIDKALEQAEQLGLLLRVNEVGIYSLNDVELFLIDKIFTDLQFEHDVANKTTHDEVIFIATELYHTGGHTRLMERLATFLDFKPDLLITKKPQASIIERENVFFSKIHDGSDGDYSVMEKIAFLLKVVLQYDIVVINTHPEDIYSIVACGLAKRIKRDIKIHFVNHADHTFSYGSSISDVWYEISDYGVAVDAKRGLKAKKCFLGIPIDTSKQNSESSYKFENGDLILSAASAGKYKPNNQKSIMPLVSALLDKYDMSTFQIIGVNVFTNYWWWAIKLKYWNRLTLCKSLPYEEYIKATSAAKLYIDSHPFPGGTAFAEQFLQGRLCVGLKTTYTGYTPLEVFKKECVDDVLEEINFISDKSIVEVKKQIESIHSFASVKVRFLDAIFKNKYARGCVHTTNHPKINKKFEIIPVGASKISKIIRITTIKALFSLCIKKSFK